ncbi:hypothetical protein GCM10010260_55990 [Streptomyces filipinensis]|uniref:Uncharacterized protein n=1 Tax=Streptomyces filipinensis TaxID=66887 RepID=A0A918IF28_9ACTN|nr:hypothetical protein GCM10010260_55990 [Streptomyces filipinensis]
MTGTLRGTPAVPYAHRAAYGALTVRRRSEPPFSSVRFSRGPADWPGPGEGPPAVRRHPGGAAAGVVRQFRTVA